MGLSVWYWTVPPIGFDPRVAATRLLISFQGAFLSSSRSGIFRSGTDVSKTVSMASWSDAWFEVKVLQAMTESANSSDTNTRSIVDSCTPLCHVFVCRYSRLLSAN